MHRTPKTFFEIRNERKQEEEKGEEDRREKRNKEVYTLK